MLGLSGVRHVVNFCRALLVTRWPHMDAAWGSSSSDIDPSKDALVGEPRVAIAGYSKGKYLTAGAGHASAVRTRNCPPSKIPTGGGQTSEHSSR